MQKFTQENIELIRSCYQAVDRKDFNTIRKAMDANIEWIEPEASGLWSQGAHRGPDAVFKEVIEPAFDKVADFRVEANQFLQVGEHIVVLGRFRGRGKNTGKELNANTVHIWTLRDGKIVRFQAYHDIANWLEALGTTAYEAQRLAA
jgi:uncharacterized protein